jgi:hypothetical protein
MYYELVSECLENLHDWTCGTGGRPPASVDGVSEENSSLQASVVYLLQCVEQTGEAARLKQLAAPILWSLCCWKQHHSLLMMMINLVRYYIHISCINSTSGTFTLWRFVFNWQKNTKKVLLRVVFIQNFLYHVFIQMVWRRLNLVALWSYISLLRFLKRLKAAASWNMTIVFLRY